MTNPIISVIIPVYNHAHTLKRSLESLAAQTYRPFEIIIVDDGSTDEFDKVIDGIRRTVKLNFKIMKQTNRGASAARNRGFHESRGEYVIFWDADTVAKPNMFEMLQQALGNNPRASYSYCQFKFGWKKMKSNEFDPKLLKETNYIDTTSLIRRGDFPGFDERLKRFQDWDLWLTMLEKGKTGTFVAEVLFSKIVGGRAGISCWLPSFVYKLPWRSVEVKKYEEARQIIMSKHQ